MNSARRLSGYVKQNVGYTRNRRSALLGRASAALALAAIAASPAIAGTPSINGLGNTTYVEQQSSPLAVATGVTITNGVSYADSYLQFSITSATSSETLALQTVGSADTTAGVVSVVGSTIYLGQGGTAKPIGSVDATLNGQNGAALRLNFSSLLANGSFEDGITSWTINNNLVTLGALATQTFQERAPNGTPTFNYQVQAESGRGNVLRMWSNGNVVGPSNSPPYGSMFGPEAWSSPFDAYAGDSLAVDWSAANGSDDYEVYGFLVNTSNNAHTLLFHGRGATQPWTTTTGNIPANGNYRFRFVSGSYDATGGLALGASLYIDNIRVFGADGNDTVATSLARLVTYSNSSLDPSASRTLNLLARASDGNQTTVTSTISITLVDDPPSISTSGGSAAYTEGDAAVFVDAGVTITDPDGGNIDGATVAITTGFASAEDALLFTNQNGITGSYNASTGILTLSGSATPANYQTALRSVRYQNSSVDPDTTARTITFSLGGSSLYFADTGHFYEFVSAAGIAWNVARTRAEDRNNYGTAGYPKGVFGMQGYLVTVTSAAENAFVASKLTGQGWMGATDEAQESIWRWVTGPEGLEDGGQGRHFFTQTGAASGSPNLISVYGGQTPGAGVSVGGFYNNWANGEPNDYPASGEDYAHFLENGQWNDYPISLGGIAGYVVEYGGIGADPVLQTTASRGLTVTSVDDPPTDIGLSNASVLHSAGANAVVGTLSTTDPDSTTFTYTLVAGTGSTDNASFNISGSSLRVNNPVALPQGSYSVRIRTTDPTSLWYEEAFSISVIDDVPPVAPSTPDLDAADDTGSSDSDNITSQTALTFTGTAEDGSTVRLYRAGGTLIGTATATGGVWSITTGALPEGTHAITATATDSANNTSTASSALNVRVDTTAPEASSIARHTPAAPETNVGVVVFRVTFNDDVVGVDLTDFELATNHTVSAVLLQVDAVSGAIYDVTVSPVSGEGDLRLDLKTSGTGIADLAGNAISGGLVGETYVLDTTGPAILGPLEDDIRWGTVGQADGQFYQPYGIAVDRSGRVYVADTYNHRIQRFDAAGAHELTFGAQGAGTGSFNLPHGVAVDATGHIYVADTNNHRIQKFTDDGTFVLTFGAQGSGAGQLFQPRDVAVGTDGAIYVVDLGNHRVQKFDAAGVFVAQWGGLGTADGKFNQPNALALSSDGHVYVADTGNNRIQKFDTAGNFVTKWGSFGTATGRFNLPGGITVDGGGNVHVADTRNNRLQKFDASGGFLSAIGTFGVGATQFYYPAGLSPDSRGRIHVADTLNNRVQVLEPIAALNDVPDDGRYRAGQHLDFVVQYSTDVVVTGSPRIVLALGGGSVDALYHAAGSSGPNVVFRYTVQPGDTDEDGIDAATSITLAGGTITDAAGNDGDLAYLVPDLSGIKIDTTAPDAPPAPDLVAASDTGASDTDNITADATPTFTGTAEVGSTVRLYADADEVGSVLAADGSWTITASTLADAIYAITVTATDVAGNVSDPSPSLAVTIDTTAPDAPDTFALTPATDSGISDSDAITSITGIVLTGLAEPGSTVTLTHVGTGVIATLTADGSGEWIHDYTSVSLAEGVHEFTATATDAAGNTSAVSAVFQVTIDLTAPAAPGAPDLLAGSDSGLSDSDDLTNDTTPTFTGTAEDGATITLYAGASAVGDTVAAGGTWTITSSALTDGVYAITARATDVAGNSGPASAALTVTIDTLAPAAPSAPDLLASSDTGQSDSDDITADTTPTFTGTAEAGSLVRLYADGDEIGSGLATAGVWTITSSTLADGSYTITAVATDAAGNTGLASAGLVVTIDDTAPAAPSTPDLTAASDSGISDTDNITNITTPVFEGTAEAGSTVTLYAGADVIGTGIATGGAWSITSSALADGVHAITATATDVAGKVSDASGALSITIKTEPPAAPAIAAVSDDTGVSSSDGITADTTLVLSGTAEAGSAVEITRVGTGVVGTTTADGSGDWSFDYTGTTLDAGTHTFTATATDAAGNTGDASTAFSVTVDTTAPAVQSIERGEPAATLTNAGTLVFTVTFDETVHGVDTGDFELAVNGTATGTISAVDALDGATYEVTITLVTGSGDLRLDLRGAGTGITDVAGNAIAAGFTAGESYAIDTVGPVILGPLEYARQWGGFGTADGEFFQPYGVAIDRAGHVYVADTFNHRVQKFAADGTFLASIGTAGSADGEFLYPMGVAVDAIGQVYVTDSYNNRVQKFTAAGAWLLSFGASGTGDGQFDQPHGIALDSSGHVYVVDRGNNRIQKFTTSGAFVTAWGGFGTGDGQLYQPRGIAVDSTGHVYVADTNNNRVQKFTAAGAYVGQWGSFGATSGTFNTLYGVAVDLADNVYVADLGNNRIQKFSSDGAFLTEWGTFGAGDGEFYYPSAVAVDESGRVYVADTFNDRIQAFEPVPALADAPADGFYRAGQALDFVIEYSSPVVVTGTPRLAISIGGTTVYATYHAAGSSGASVVFRYVIQPGDTSDGIAILSAAIDLDGGTIRDAAGNDGTLVFASPALPDIVIDTTAPSAPAITGVSTDDGYSSTDGITTDSALVFAGTAEVGATVALTHVGVGVIGTAIADGAGQWTFDHTGTVLADGAHQFTAVATDLAGNDSEASAAFDVVVLYAPVIDSAGTASGTFGSAFSYQITATQSPTGFGATGLPAGLSIDTTTGAITGTPGASGTFNITITAINPISSDSTTLVLTIGKATASVTLGGLAQTYTGAPRSATATTVPAGLTVDLTYDGSPTAPTAAGSYTVVATIDDANYQGTATDTLVVAQAAQSISFGALADRTYGDAPFALSATATSGLPVSFSVTSGPASISGGMLTITGAGAVTVQATQAGDANHLAAPSVDRTFAVAKAPAAVTLGSLAQTYTGAPLAATATTTPVGLTVDFTYDGSATAPTAAGSYTVVGTINEANYQGSASGTLVISKATATVTLGNLAQTYTGTPRSVTATTTPAGLTVDFTYGGSATAPTGAGSYTVVGTINDANYQGSASGTLVVAKATAVITLGGLQQVYDGTPKSAYATTTPAGLAGAITYNGSVGAPTAIGSYVVVGTIDDPNYTGTATDTFVIAKPTASVTLAGLDATYDGTAKSVIVTTVPAGLTVNTTYAGSATPPTAAGSYAVVATIDDEIYQGTASGTLVIAKAGQTISFAPLADRTTQPPSFTLEATATSGLPVSFAVTSGPATISGSTVTLTGLAGTVEITATQAGDANRAAAAPVVRSFAVVPHGPATFFGALESDGVPVGEFAAYLDEDGQSGVIIGLIPGTGTGFVIEFAPDGEGNFTATTTLLPGGTVTLTVAGQASFFGIAGVIDELGLTFSAAAEAVDGSSAGRSGQFISSPLDTADGRVYTIIGSDGRSFVLADIDGVVDGGTGTVNGSTGAFTVTTASGGQFSGSIDSTTGGLSGTMTTAGGTTIGFAGLPGSVTRTDRLANLSSRGRVGPTQGLMIMGFVVTGSDPKPVLVRAVGPALTGFGVVGAAPNPRLRLFRGSELIATNDDWSTAPNLDDVLDVTAATGAFDLPAESKDSALYLVLQPGVYTAQVDDTEGEGVVLAEVYDASDNPGGEVQRLVNISTRGYAATGEDVLVGGLVITGNAPKRVLIRGVGPSLLGLGVDDALANPRLTLFSGGDIIASNDTWGQGVNSSASIVSASARVGAFPLAAGSEDAVLLLTLMPGAYTVQVSAVGAPGTALIEVYEVP